MQQAESQLKREYVERQVIPWMIAHLQMRSTGLQVFVAVQGALLYGFASTKFWGVSVLGLASCLSFALWDARNRDVFRRLHHLAEVAVDRSIFGEGPTGKATEGLHVQALGTLAASGSANPTLGRSGGFGSHTWAIRIMILTSAVIWIVQIVPVLAPIARDALQ